MARRIVMMLGVCMLLPHPSVSSSVAQTDIVVPFSVMGFQSGVVDSVDGRTIRIDGRTYVLKSAVVVVTHEGEPLEIERILPTSRVKYQLKEGHIEKMVVTLPQ